MTALIFLAIPLVIIALGGFVLWFRHRRPKSIEFSVESFRREMRALSPTERRGVARGRSEPGSG